jgi:hypothetical protein
MFFFIWLQITIFFLIKNDQRIVLFFQRNSGFQWWNLLATPTIVKIKVECNLHWKKVWSNFALFSFMIIISIFYKLWKIFSRKLSFFSKETCLILNFSHWMHKTCFSSLLPKRHKNLFGFIELSQQTILSIQLKSK